MRSQNAVFLLITYKFTNSDQAFTMKPDTWNRPGRFLPMDKGFIAQSKGNVAQHDDWTRLEAPYGREDYYVAVAVSRAAVATTC